MLLTAPAFLFLFLPLALFFYAICGKGRRRACLLVICGAYHLILNLFHLQTLLILALLILYTYFVGFLIRKIRRPAITLVSCALPYVALLALRGLAYVGPEQFLYPIGLTVSTMASTSYLMDGAREETAVPYRFSDLCLYLSFFPVLLVGPFIKYSEFLTRTREEQISFSVSSFADGARLYMLGFIKRIAVGAVLMETYSAFVSSLSERSDGLVTLFAIILIYFGVYFVISGYSDMGCGLAWMLGVRVEYRPANPFCAVLPDEYGPGLLGSFYEWMEAYLLEPARRLTGGRLEHLLYAITYGGLLMAFIYPSHTILLFVIPSILLSYLSARFRWKQWLKKRIGLRILTAFLTMIFVSLTWMFITVGDVKVLWDHLTHLTYFNSEYNLDLLLVTFSGVEYLFVLALAVLALLPTATWGHRKNTLRAARVWTILESVGSLLLLLLFAFALLFFLPQYGMYNTSPFQYIIV